MIMLISEITNEIKIERNLLLTLFLCATERPYTAKNERPKIMTVTENVMIFLQIL